MDDYMHSDTSNMTVSEVGEKWLVREITEFLDLPERLVDGYGNDAAFVDCCLGEGELLTVNTDRSGLNLAFQLGLAGPECVGDLGVSHAISDIVAGGAEPIAVTVALLLPPDTQVEFVKDVMSGAQSAAKRYGAFIACGDTKQNPKFALVVTAFGKVERDKRLGRGGAKPGDKLIVTGYLGSMLLASRAFRDEDSVPKTIAPLLAESLISQHPPFALGRAISDAGLANACMDISDGLAGALYSLCGASGVGAKIDEAQIPIDPLLQEYADSLGLRRIQLSLAGGDWEYLYAVPANALNEIQRIADKVNYPFRVIGHTVCPDTIGVITLDGEYRHLERIEHDSFSDGMKGKNYFERLSEPQHCFGNKI